MTVEHWERVKKLLHHAMQLPPEQRAGFLAQACSNDNALRAEVESLLQADEDVRSSFLQSAPLADARGARFDPADTADMLQPSPGLPPKFGPYEILGPIAKGGMGEVYRARDTRLGRYVAVKILPADLCRDLGRLARFEHEARAASALNHPNIVSVYDFGRESGIPFIVTELIEGESLRRLLTKGPVPAEKLIEIATQLAAGLKAAHVAGIVHRDIKPENIMLTPDMRVKILDFGLAKHTSPRLDAARSTETEIITAPGLVLGTVGYLSPEQVRGDAADERSDIFSLGAVLYELAAGKRPFIGDKAIEVLSAILREEPSQLHADIPPALERIICRCLRKDPQLRLQNAASLEAALKGIGKISGMRRVFWAIERQRRVWAVAAIATAILVAGSFWLVPRWPNRHTPAPPPPNNVRSAAVAQPPGMQSTVATAGTPGDTKEREVKKAAPPAATPEPPQTAKQTVTPSIVAEPSSHRESKEAAAKEATPPAAVPDPPKSDPPKNDLPKNAPPKNAPPVVAQTLVIETLAGRPWKFTAEGLPALQVALAHCDDLKCDRAGNIFVSDWGNRVIVKIDPGGIMHVLAGPGSPPGDQPSAPHGLAMDSSGAIYFAEVFAIRKLLPDGRIVPVAGNNSGGFTPDGARALGSRVAEVTGIALAADGSVIFSEFSNRLVRRVDPQGRLQTIAGNGTRGFSGDGGPAPRASLGGPRALLLDRAGNLFIADPPNGCVRKVSRDGKITTVAGHGVAGNLSCPTGLALSQRGDLFIADPCSRQVLQLRASGLVRVGGNGAEHQELSGDGGPALAASFDEWSLAFDEQDNLLVSGPEFGHVYRISRDGKFNIIAGSGFWGATRDGTPASQAIFREPFRVAADSAGNIFMTDLPANRIYRIDRKGIVTQVAGYSRPGYDGDNTPARNYRLNGPNGIRVGPNGNIVFADRENNLVREVTTAGRLRTIAGNLKPEYSGDGGRAVEAGLNNPVGVCFDKSGNLYIADTGNHRVRKVTPDGKILTVAGNGTAGFAGDGGPPDRASLNTPRAVEVDTNGDLYIADMGNHRVRRVSGGVIDTLAGDGQLGSSGDGGPASKARLDLPGDLALGADRQLYILDRPRHRIRRIDLASGIITTFAGNGENVASGDGGPPTKAGLGDPAGIALDAAGNVYVTDRASQQLRVIRPAR